MSYDFVYHTQKRYGQGGKYVTKSLKTTTETDLDSEEQQKIPQNTYLQEEGNRIDWIWY